ncbi:MAG: RHS repeat-associated core domain-containing protein, partial [Verrucomicrobiota bacterium]
MAQLKSLTWSDDNTWYRICGELTSDLEGEWQGNIRKLIDLSSDQIVAEYGYSPFGELLSESGPGKDICPFRFQSKYYDKLTELYYYGFRYYHPASGKWLNREPLGEGASPNLLAFCHNDPINNVDVLGLDIVRVRLPDGRIETLLHDRNGRVSDVIGDIPETAGSSAELYQGRLQERTLRRSEAINSVLSNGENYVLFNYVPHYDTYEGPDAFGLGVSRMTGIAVDEAMGMAEALGFLVDDPKLIAQLILEIDVKDLAGGVIESLVQAMKLLHASNRARSRGDEVTSQFLTGMALVYLAREVAVHLSGTRIAKILGPFAENLVERMKRKDGFADSSRAQNTGRVVANGSCFVAGTLVATETGHRPIEEIKQGDRVWSYNHNSHEWELRDVVSPLAHNFGGRIYSIEVGGARVDATHNHPFWVVQGEDLVSRPKADDVPPSEYRRQGEGRWVEAEDLLVGDLLALKSGRFGSIEKIAFTEARVVVYNITVDRLH